MINPHPIKAEVNENQGSAHMSRNVTMTQSAQRKADPIVTILMVAKSATYAKSQKLAKPARGI